MCSRANSLQGFLLPQQGPVCVCVCCLMFRRPVLKEAAGRGGIKTGEEAGGRGEGVWGMWHRGPRGMMRDTYRNLSISLREPFKSQEYEKVLRSASSNPLDSSLSLSTHDITIHWITPAPALGSLRAKKHLISVFILCIKDKENGASARNVRTLLSFDTQTRIFSSFTSLENTKSGSLFQ